MAYCSKPTANSNTIIHDVEVTDDVLTSRAGLSLFVRYLQGIQVYQYLEELFGKIRKSKKGLPLLEIFKQIFCFFLDGTSRHLIYFDTLKDDEGYARTIECEPDKMLSSHRVKRFFKAFVVPLTFLFRRILQRLFLWRLQIAKPALIMLGLDTMVMDNDEAQKRQGVKPTHKKVKGFQPLQMTWGRFIIDAVFRSGDKHSNHGSDVEKMVRQIVGLIRKHYREDVPIIIRLDSGFFDQKLLEVFESLQIGYICGGKLYDDIKAFVTGFDETAWGHYRNQGQVWDYIEMGDRRGSWKKFRRAIFCRPQYEGRQKLLSFARPETMLYTNLGRGEVIDESLRNVGLEKMVSPEEIIASYHGRGSDELIHRGFKEFGCQQLPFKRFAQNSAFYYTMVTAFFLYEAFKEDVCTPVIEVGSYATTLRRKIIDVAGKIVRHAGRTVLKVTVSSYKHLDFSDLWRRSGNPPQIALT